MEERQDPWKKVLLLFIIFILLVGCTNTPRLKNEDFITAWTIAVSVVGLCVGIVFSLVLRSLAKSIEADLPSNNSSSYSINSSDVESGIQLPPSYSKCCSTKPEKTDELPSYEEAISALQANNKTTNQEFSSQLTGQTDLSQAVDVRRQLEDTSFKLEQEIFNQEQRRVCNVNELRLANAQVAELADRVAKARLKESVLADKVTLWVNYLKEEKIKFLLRENRKCAGQIDELDHAIGYQIDRILEKRKAVDECLEETRNRRKQHKNHLRKLRSELEELQQNLKDWDIQGQEIQGATDRLKIRRQQLEEQLAEKKKVEVEERARFQQLEMEMDQLVRKSAGRREESLSFDDLLVSNTEDGSTTLAEGIFADVRRLRDAYQ